MTLLSTNITSCESLKSMGIPTVLYAFQENYGSWNFWHCSQENASVRQPEIVPTTSYIWPVPTSNTVKYYDYIWLCSGDVPLIEQFQKTTSGDRTIYAKMKTKACLDYQYITLHMSKVYNFSEN